jgi:hypothetical protein
MATTKDKDYSNLEAPYSDLMFRSEGVLADTGGGSTEPGEIIYATGSPTEAAATTEGNSSAGATVVSAAAQVKADSVQTGQVANIWIDSWIKSTNYLPKARGFMIDGPRGYIECRDLFSNNAIITGTITATSGKIANWYINLNTLSSGAAEATSNVLIDSANSLIRLGPVAGDYITIDGANKRIRSSNYASGAFGSGFSLDSDLLEVGNISARGMIRTAVFQKDIISATAGGQVIAPNSDVLDVDMTALDASTLTTKGTTTLAVGDILRIKDGVYDEWMEVTNIASAPTYIVTRDKKGDYPANANPAWTKGSTVVDYGISGQGGVYMTASEANAPYLSIFTHAGAPWTTLTQRARLGNLTGLNNPDTGVALSGYGLWTDNIYLTGVVVANSGKIGGSAGWVITTNYIKDVAGVVGLSSIVTGGDDIRFWAGHGTPASAPFQVTKTGALLALSATITGDITASTGTIGSFTIGTYLYTGTKTAYNDANAGVHLGSDGLGIGNNIFTVSSAGALVATSATITGAITATSGTIGSFTIGTYLYTGTKTAYNDTNAGVHLGSDGLGIGNNVFRVSSAGALLATSATITGAITATSGTIGSFTIGTYLYTGSKTAYNDANAGVHLGSDGLGIGNNVFTVSSAGALVATSATITGAITASSGSVGSFTIGTYLYTGSKTAYNDANAGVHLGSDGLGIGNNIFTVSSAGALVATSATITGSVSSSSGNEKIVLDSGDYLRFYTGGTLRASIRGVYGSASFKGIVCDADVVVNNDRSFWIKSSAGTAGEEGGISITSGNALWVTVGTDESFYIKSNDQSANYLTVSSARTYINGSLYLQPFNSNLTTTVGSIWCYNNGGTNQFRGVPSSGWTGSFDMTAV